MFNTIYSQTPCGFGEFSTTGNTPCSLCPPGRFQDMEGQMQCNDCPAGFYSENFGESSCTQYPPGTTGPSGSNSITFCTAVAGNTQSIPTLSQWSLFILMIGLCIVGLLNLQKSRLPKRES